MVIVLLSGAGAIVWLLLPPRPPAAPAPPPPKVVIAGAPLSLGPNAIAEALDLVRRYARRSLSIKLPGKRAHSIRPAVLGAEIDRAHLAQLVLDASNRKSALRRAYEQRRQEDAAAVLHLPVPVRIDTVKAVVALVAVKDQIDRAAADAVVDVEKKKLVPEKWGYRLDVYTTLARIDEAVHQGATELEAAVEKIKPRVLAAQLGNVKFDQVLGSFSTRYARSRRARSFNLRLAASKLDGTVLLPGETFDFNKTVGPRDEANGYKVAPVIAEGELVDGIGGGTCQVSGTLHAAAFFAGLEIVERTAHSRPSSYIKLGLDAAVAYPTINFRVRNNLDVPVVLHEVVGNDGWVRAEVLGAKRRRTVTFFRRVDQVLPFEEVERPTADLREGRRRLSQRGVPGFKTTVFRVVREGAYAWRTKTFNHYPPTTQIVKVGTAAEKSKRKVKSDRSLEYRADEYLVITQGPKIKSPAKDPADPYRKTVESRVPGRYGRSGWQEKAGMKVFKADEEESEKP